MYLPIVYSSKSVNWWGIANKISNKITWARRAKARFTFKERIHLKIKKKMKVLNRSNHLHLVMRILLPEWVMKRDIGFSKLSIKISLKISFSIENPKKVSVSLRIQLQIYSHRIWGKKYRNNLTILHMKMRKNSMILYLKMKKLYGLEHFMVNCINTEMILFSILRIAFLSLVKWLFMILKRLMEKFG